MRRINAWMALGMIGLAACGKESGPTSLAPSRFDPAIVSANLALIDQVNKAPVLVSFRSLGSQSIVAGSATAARGMADFQAQLAAGNGIGAMRDVASGLAALLGPASVGPALVPIIRAELLGKTFIYDATAKKYVVDPTRAGAPANGVRFVLYETDEATKQPIVEKEIGYSDLIDEKAVSPSSVGLRLRVVSNGTTYLDYTFDVSGGISSAAVAVAGYLTDGTERVNFDLKLSGQLIGRNGAATLEGKLEIPSHKFSATVKVQGTAGTESGDGQFDVALQFDKDAVTLSSKVADNHLEATVKVNGTVFATATGDPKNPVIKGEGGRDLTADELAALGHVVEFTGQLFGILAGLLGPVVPLILMGFGL